MPYITNREFHAVFERAVITSEFHSPQASLLGPISFHVDFFGE